MRSSGRRERDLRHRVAQHAGRDRVALGVVGVQQAVRRVPLDHLGELPAQVHRILHAGVEALSAHRGMHVRGVAGQQDASVAVGRGLPGHVGEPGDPGRTVDPEVGPVDGDERLAEIAQGGFARGPEVRLGHHDPHRSRRPRRPPRRRGSRTPTCRGRGCRGRRGGCPTPAPRSSRPRRSGCWSSDPSRGTRCRPPCGSGCVRRRTRRDTPPAATRRRTARRRRRCRPARSPSPRARDRSAPPARRPSRPGCARCGSATARARSGAGWESR